MRIKLIVLALILLAVLPGCRTTEKIPAAAVEFDAFSVLGVSREAVPAYEATPYKSWGQREGKPKVYNVWDSIKVGDISEEQAKKIIADFITRHQEGNDHILIGVNDDKYYYVGEYYKNANAEENYRGPARASAYPVIYYRKTPA